MFSRSRLKSLAALIVVAVYPAVSRANDLKPDTLSAWDKYVAAIKLQMQQRVDGSTPFLWANQSPDRLQRVHGGEILVARTGGDAPSKVPHGMIHDWTGVVFLPGFNLGQVMRVLDDYARYQDFYKPQVVESKFLDRTGDDERVRLLIVQSALGVTAAVDTENDVHIERPSPTRAYTFSYSTHVHEIADFGKPNQRQLPEDHGPGYVWRVLTVTRLEERDGGVYVEDETIEMSRSIPLALRFLVKPLTEHLARNIMLGTMTNMQKAVIQQSAVDAGKPPNSPSD